MGSTRVRREGRTWKRGKAELQASYNMASVKSWVWGEGSEEAMTLQRWSEGSEPLSPNDIQSLDTGEKTWAKWLIPVEGNSKNAPKSLYFPNIYNSRLPSQFAIFYLGILWFLLCSHHIPHPVMLWFQAGCDTTTGMRNRNPDKNLVWVIFLRRQLLSWGAPGVL